MMDSKYQSLVSISTNPSTLARGQHSRQLPNHNRYAGLENTSPMETNDQSNQQSSKKKRADTNPDEHGSSHQSCSPSLYLSQSPIPNQLGLMFPPTSTPPAYGTPSNTPVPHNPSGIRGRNTMLHRIITSTLIRRDTIPPPNQLASNSLTDSAPPNDHLQQEESDIVNSWKFKIPGIKGLVYPHDTSYSEDLAGQIAECMEQAISLHLGCTPHCHRPHSHRGLRKQETQQLPPLVLPPIQNIQGKP
ncbi:hypothetical protein BJ322DRAFT_1159175 [Thelephora terrestris]|uniref:Uncharacterized protein n=1 Tax=Thelephora terrestris TaxID=56493 RepID=A0A9P6H9A4_9AGAM|nr:hypothetical protein BJ322DRAFT_1159175 [Thelephora terrestris]